TGGKHRSVAIVEEIGKYLEKKHKNKIYIKHRDIDRS
ncbi:MAG TPA: RNase adapter RapZ, partial [Flexistipes sinusarabici]|nr:RNase adapter RapZ [Flexistipes sinusarabici]